MVAWRTSVLRIVAWSDESLEECGVANVSRIVPWSDECLEDGGLE